MENSRKKEVLLMQKAKEKLKSEENMLKSYTIAKQEK